MARKSTRSKTKLRFKCPDCGSTVVREMLDGIIMEHCSNDLLPEFSQYFQWFHKQDDQLKVSLMVDWDEVKHNLYGQWYISTQDSSQPFECVWRIDPRAKLFTPSRCAVSFPDTAQHMIAKWILKRPLTEQELTGQRHVPIISEDGTLGEGEMDVIMYPQDVTIKYKDMVDKTTYELMPKLFDKEKL